MIFGDPKVIKYKKYALRFFILSLLLFGVNLFYQYPIKVPITKSAEAILFEPGGFIKGFSNYNASQYFEAAGLKIIKQYSLIEPTSINETITTYYFLVLNPTTKEIYVKLPGKIYIQDAQNVYTFLDLISIAKFTILLIALVLYIYAKIQSIESAETTKVF